MSSTCCKSQSCRDDLFSIALVATGTIKPASDRLRVVPVAYNPFPTDDALLHGFNLTPHCSNLVRM